MPTENFYPTQTLLLKAAAPGRPPAAVVAQTTFVPDQPGLNQPGKTPGDLLLEPREGQATLWVSLGAEAKLSLDALRKAGGALGKWLLDGRAAAIDLDVRPLEALPLENAAAAFLEGVKLGNYRFSRYKSEAQPPAPVTVSVLSSQDGAFERLLERVNVVSDLVLLAREWGHEPANEINPPSLAQRAQALAEAAGLTCRILDENELAGMQAGGVLAVGQGSQTPPRLIVLEYPGKGKADPVVLVGKAITFDTGGYSLKDTTNIQHMKYDKCGGIAVIAALAAAARLGIDQPLVGVVGAAENMISAQAYRPDDILTTLSGKTVEIVSTDAEGRLVLADALTYSQQHYHPRAVIDLATLTGGVVVALGHVRGGLMGNDDALAQALIQAGERTGERLWQLPLDDEYLEATKGEDADLKNSGGREGHAILGGIFLKQFVDDSVPWAHLDIAGMADTNKDLPYCPKGATGFGVRLLLDYLENL